MINLKKYEKKISNNFVLKIKKLVYKILKIIEIENANGSVFYIAGSDKLPAPLKPEEERLMLLRLEKKDLIAKNILIERNLRLVVYVAKKFENTNINIEDLISIGTIGLLKAINSFKMDKNIKLATYASRCIENEILMFLRKTNKLKLEVSLDEPINTDAEGNELGLGDIIYSDKDCDNIEKIVELQTDKKILLSLIEKLEDRDKQIIKLRYGLDGSEEYTQKEVAKLLNISQSYISRIEKKIICDMKKIFIK